MRSVVDGDGLTNTISYVTSNAYSTNLISSITDPFGRTATFAYNDRGCLTNVTDVTGISTSFLYDEHDYLTNMTTPYGSTSFTVTDNSSAFNSRSILVTQPDGGHQLFLHTNGAPGISSSYSSGEVPATSPYANNFDNSSLDVRNTFHWGVRQYANLSTTNIGSFTADDFRKARMKHWLNSTTNVAGDRLIGHTVSLERDPSPDNAGTVEGQKTWYDYAGKTNAAYEGTQSSPLFVARVLPDGTTSFTRNERNPLGAATNVVSTFSVGSTVYLRTNRFLYFTNDTDLLTVTNSLGVQTSSNLYNAYHQVATNYNALNEPTVYTFTTNQEVTSITRPTGLITTNIYGSDGFLSSTYDYAVVGGSTVYYRTNSYTYPNNLIHSHTDERGMTETNLWDNLQRLLSTSYPDGSYVSNIYTYLDRAATKDRNGYWTTYGFDSMRRNTSITNSLGYYRLMNYCTCGSLDSIQDEAGNYTYFFADNQARVTNTVFADSYAVTNFFDLAGRTTNTTDSAGMSVTNWFSNQGLLVAISNAFGQAQATIFDPLDRATNSTDANGVSVSTTFDDLDRVLTRTYADSGIESFGYTPGVASFTSQTNQIGSNVLNVSYDPLGRKTSEVIPGVMTNSFTYTPAGELKTLTDGRGLVTTFGIDEYGRTTNKLDQSSSEILRYKFDPAGRLTNRWSAAVGDTRYSWDTVGNLTNIHYPHDGDIRMAYDVLNRLTNMVDGVGTNKFSYSATGQLLTEDGPWASDTVTNTYANRLRVSLSLAQPAGFWTNGFGYDQIKRLTNITISAGSFSYQYPASSDQNLISKITLPNTSYVTNTFDSVARQLSTLLKNSSGTVLDSYTYAYNPANQRTNVTRTDSSTLAYRYDNAGELTVADSSVSAEDRGYFYDAGWNLARLTNNGVTSTLTVNTLNELTNAPSGSASFDSNGNTLTSHGGDWTYQYDDENRLISLQIAINGTNSTFSDFYYDGFGRLRKRLEYIWVPPAQGTNPPPDDGPVFGGLGGLDTPQTETNWSLISETRYIYDGNRVIQERDGNNTPTVTYTRGTDLSGSLEGAGGIGGLLARSSGYSSGTGNWSTNHYYHADGNGNVTYLVDGSQSLAARYRYDPFGNLIGSGGSLADANVYRFSSKEVHVASGLYYYLYRFYDPSLQRWINRDPIGEAGFETLPRATSSQDDPNLYGFVHNEPVTRFDPKGLIFGCSAPPDCKRIGTGKRNCHQDSLETDDPAVGYDVPATDIGSGKFAQDFARLLADKGYKEVPCSAKNVGLIVWYGTYPNGLVIPLHSSRKEACGWRHIGIGKEGEVWCCETRNAAGDGAAHGHPDKPGGYVDPKTGKPNNKCFAK